MQADRGAGWVPGLVAAAPSRAKSGPGVSVPVVTLPPWAPYEAKVTGLPVRGGICCSAGVTHGSDPVLREQERAEPFPDEVRRARRLDGGGVTGEEVGALEDRPGAMLPTSCRQFLLTSNGWRKHRA